jgi:hypothetical protein
VNTRLLDPADRPQTLLPTTRISDFSRNFAELEKRARRPYSIVKVIRDITSGRPHLDGFEMEVSQELQALNRGRNVNGTLVPMEALAPWRRDLTTVLPVIQTSVEPEAPISFLRAKTICGRLRATLIDGLVSGQLGNLKLPRATGGGVAQWQPEVGGSPDSDQNFDSITSVAKRITGSTVLSRQLILQSSPDIEDFVKNDLSAAIGVAVDNAAINGNGTAHWTRT